MGRDVEEQDTLRRWKQKSRKDWLNIVGEIEKEFELGIRREFERSSKNCTCWKREGERNECDILLGYRGNIQVQFDQLLIEIEFSFKLNFFKLKISTIEMEIFETYELKNAEDGWNTLKT